jgi:adenosylhomocysteine nucleosidase
MDAAGSLCAVGKKSNAAQKFARRADLRFHARMTLHGDISLNRPLLVVALEEEATHLHVSELPILVTGVGKICAAASLAAILSRQRPSRIVNLGTAGALREGLDGTHVIGRVIQHDFDDEAIFGLTGTHFGPPIELGPGPVLASGDVFVSGGPARDQLGQRAALVDMEGYAVAMVAREFGLPVTLVKEVSDGAGESAARSWQESLDDCAERLGAWVRRELLAA